MKSTYRKNKIISALALCVSVLFLCITAFAATNISSRIFAESLESGVRVKENTELRYYLTVNYDGVDKDGVESSDETIANIKSNVVEVTDKLPDGLTFVGFEATESGIIAATSRADSNISCLGHVIDDTNEDIVTTGVWNDDQSEFTYHGLHYDAASRTVSFKAENIKAGCGLTVGIITETPSLGDADRVDFYNTASVKEGNLHPNSNTVHVWMGLEETELYQVSYRYTGDLIPDNAPDPSAYNGQYAADTSVSVAAAPNIDGYTFSGWHTDDADIIAGSFTMPSQNVELVGNFTEKPAETEYKVTYVIEGETPDGYIVPKEKTYPAGTIVALDSAVAGDMFSDYVFSGWSSETADLSTTGFTMPDHDVIIIGSFTQQVYTVHYEFQGTVIPENAPELLPADEQYPAGVTVTTAANPIADGYRFTGWYKNETFTMPAEDVTILGEWSVQAGTFAPEITKVVLNQKDAYNYGDTVDFEIAITNTADFEIRSVQILEKLDGAEFIAGDDYELKTPQYAFVPSIAAGGTVTIKAQYKVTENANAHFENIVVLSGALADDNYNLDTDQDYTASAEFDTQATIIGGVISDIIDALPKTDADSIVKYLIIITLSAIGICVAVIVIRHERKVHPEAFAKAKRIVPAVIASVTVVAFTATSLYSAFAAQQSTPVPSIRLTSKNTSYGQAEEGAWDIDKSAMWTSQNTAQVTFTVDSIIKAYTGYKDVLFVVDISGSMRGEKIAQVQNDMAELTESLLQKDGNRIGIVSFSTTADVIFDFTTDKDALLAHIDKLEATDNTNYYDALIKAEDVLQNYKKQDDRELVLLFLTDGYPNEETPNEVAQYELLKAQHPYITINAIQYEMGKDILEPIKVISDFQFIADMETLENVLFDAAALPYVYDDFVITDLIDDDYWTIDSVTDITASTGKVQLDWQGSTPKITWALSGMLRSGDSATLTINLKLKSDRAVAGDLYPTNKGETASSTIEDVPDENVTSDDTPILRADYQVIYEGNDPSDCTVAGIPDQETHMVFDAVEISDTIPTCDGYNFGGYGIVDDDVQKINDDYFTMPEKDVILRATWTKVSIKKDMDGTVFASQKLYDAIAEQSIGLDAKTNFNSFTADTFGVNTFASTANDEYPVHYFRGDISNNNVLFADICWQAFRTTSTGGVKLIYNGLPTDGQCLGKGGNIGSSTFNSGYLSAAYVGYMYGTASQTTGTYLNVRKEGYVYGNDISWDEETKTYTLIDTYTITNWDDDWETLTYGYHYTCASESDTCTSAYYVNLIQQAYTYAYSLSGGKNLDSLKAAMFANNTESNIKKAVDEWYANTLADTEYESMIEDSVYCNDRVFASGPMSSKDYDATVNNRFGGYWRNWMYYNPSLDCSKNDSFTVSEEIGNGKLTYPVGLITIDELDLAGINANSYIANDSYSWTMSPSHFDYYYAYGLRWAASKGTAYPTSSGTVRPVITILHDLYISDGDGNGETPWTVNPPIE